MSKPEKAKIGVITVSDRASRGEYEDLGGPAIERYLEEVLESPYETTRKIISDDQKLIEETIIEPVSYTHLTLPTTPYV